MTTLPQTTPIRLPRPNNGSSSLAVSAPSVPGTSGGGTGAGFQMTGGDVWRVIRTNLWLIFLFVALAGAGGYALNEYYLVKNYSVYTTSALLQVSAVQVTDPLHPNMNGMDIPGLVVQARTDAEVIRSDSFINDVLTEADSPIRQTAWWTVTCDSNPQKARTILLDKLAVTPLADSQLIRVYFSAPSAKDTRIILNAVCQRLIADRRDMARHKTEAEHAQVVELKNHYDMELRAVTTDIAQKASELNLNGMGTSGHMSSKELELTEKVREQLKLQTDAITADAQYNSYMDTLKRGDDPAVIQERVNNDAMVAQYRSAVENADDRLSSMQAKFGPSNSMVIEASKSRDNFQRKLDDARAEKTAQLRESIKAELLANKDNTDHARKAVDAQVDKVKQDMADLANKMSVYSLRKDDEARLRDLVKRADERLSNLDQLVRSTEFGAIELVRPPQEPDSPSFPKLPATMGVAVAAGLALSLGIAFLREVTDTTVRSPRDIARVGQMNLLGMVPHEADDPQSAGARLPLVIFEAPQSIMAEQLRQVRTRLQHAASLDTTRSILVTSPSPGDGKSTIAVNLAAGLALNGRRILLVDSNFRRPELHRIFGIGNEVGFSDVLNDLNVFDSSVRETTVPNLSVMGSGPKPSNPTELLESQLLLDFIERALEEYDHVVFDSGPMLFVSESVALAPRVDGVVTVVRARTNTRGVLQRMRDGLRSVKAEHLGVVLNGVRNQAGGYYGRSIKTYYEYQNG